MNFDLRNILVFRVGSLGDTLVGLPALWRIRESFPQARITYLTNSDVKNPHYLSAKNVLPENGLIDAWMSYPSGSSTSRLPIAMARLSNRIRRKEFDSLIYLMPRNRSRRQIFRDKLFFRTAGISNIIGLGYLLGNRLTIRSRNGVREVESERQFLLDCLNFDDFPDSGKCTTDLCLTTAETEIADKWLTNAVGAMRGPNRFAAMAPGSNWESKVWPFKRFEEVGFRLIRDKGLFPIIFGGSEDQELGDRLIKSWSIGANAAGTLSVREAAAALSRCELYVGNDTGTMHLAAVVGTPCVGIFAAVDWIGRWEPIGTGHCNLRKRVECEGCHSNICFNNHKCLDLIGTDEVISACWKILDQRTTEESNGQNRTL